MGHLKNSKIAFLRQYPDVAMETVVLTWTSCHAQDTASRPTNPSTASYDGRSRPCNYSGGGDSIHACQITQNKRSHTSLPSTHNSLPLYTNLPYSIQIYINLSCFHFLFSERKQNLLTKFYSQKRPNAISGHDWLIGLQWMKIQNHISGFCARERNEEIPYDMVLWICSTE